ncbi:MAG TPA: hydrogenase iron-sulfur subunit [Burkholderiaceae bacterium]|nr:hydrogenase iron-sulfur subunit [Burkholderiaceae bacterium]
MSGGLAAPGRLAPKSGAVDAGGPERCVRAAERALDRVFGTVANPLRQLGALTFWMLWIVVVSGFWIYALYETSVDGAYRSVQTMTEQQPLAGGLMRSLHRYASDALIVLALLHGVREAMLGRFRAFRWYTWVSGVPLLPLALASGVVGYWMVWDQRAQYTGVAVLEWLAWLPGFDAGMVRNFIDADAISDRFFSLLAFAHIGLPLSLLLGAWAHLLRLARPHTQPVRTLAIGSTLMLAALSLAWPARSLPAVDLALWPQRVEIDWFYLGMLPLADAAPRIAGVTATMLTLALLALPWRPRRGTAPPAAVVDPAHCNGCTLCQADCPYGAIEMVPHVDGRVGVRMATVSAELCAGCGICVGACPSATPFRRAAPVATGIDLPQLPLATLRAQLDHALAALRAVGDGPRVIVLGCDRGATLDDRAPDPGVRVTAAGAAAMLGAPCVALWPPVFIEYALRGGADGVLVTGCPPADCAYRLGARWTAQRLAGERAPHLRAQVPRERVRLHWFLREDKDALLRAVDNFQRTLAERMRDCQRTADTA